MSKLFTQLAILLSLIVATTTVVYANRAKDSLELAKSLYYKNPKNVAGVISCCNKAIQLDPKLAAAYAWRGSLYSADLGQPQKALQDFTMAVQLDPKDGFSYMGRGSIYMKQGEYMKAIADYTAALKIYNRYSEAHYELGVILNKLGKYREALYHLNTAIEIDPNYKEAYLMRAQTYTKLGQHKLANKDKKIWQEIGD